MNIVGKRPIVQFEPVAFARIEASRQKHVEDRSPLDIQYRQFTAAEFASSSHVVIACHLIEQLRLVNRLGVFFSSSSVLQNWNQTSSELSKLVIIILVAVPIGFQIVFQELTIALTIRGLRIVPRIVADAVAGLAAVGAFVHELINL